MRNNDPIFWPNDDVNLNIIRDKNKNYNDSLNILQTQWYNADIDQRCQLGDQSIWPLVFPNFQNQSSRDFNFNLVNGFVQTALGFQIRNRKSITCIPIHAKESQTADQLTKCLFHTNNKSGTYQIYSTAFEAALVQGLGFVYSYIDYSEDPISGDIKKSFVDMKSCAYDVFFRKHDMSDCRFWMTRKFTTLEEAAERYEQFADKILSMPRGNYKDDKFYFMPEVYQTEFPNLAALDEYWYLTTREATFLVDKVTEECQEWTSDEKTLKEVMNIRAEDGQPLRKHIAVIKRQKPTVRRMISINDRVIADEGQINGLDRYPVAPSLGYFSPDTAYFSLKFRGIVRDCRDIQYLFNRLKVNDLSQVEAQQSGIKVESGALVTPTDALNKGHGRVLTTKKGMFDKVDKWHIDPPSPVLLQMEDMLKEVMMQVSGITPEMMGQEIDDQSGIITMLRQYNSITRLQPIFDRFDEFQRLDGEISTEMIMHNYTIGKIKQIIQEEPTEEFYNNLFLKYGCKIVPGVLTESQQQMEAHQLIYMREKLQIPVSSKRIIEKLVIQNKKEIIEEIEQQEKQQNEQAQKRAELEMQQIQVDNQTKISYAEAQKSLAHEREAKIIVDQAIGLERINRSKEEETASILNLLKAIKELEGIDLDHLQKKIEILHSVNQSSNEESTQNQSQAAS
jgi:hypothetical protein